MGPAPRATVTEEQQVTSAGISALSYTPDGGEIVGLDGAGSIFRLDADTLEQIAEPIPLEPTAPLEARMRRHGWRLLRPRSRRAYGRGRADAPVRPHGSISPRAGSCTKPTWGSSRRAPPSLPTVAGSPWPPTPGRSGCWSSTSWEWVRPPIPAHSGWALNVSWAPDGTLFASAGQDGRVILWDGRTGERLGTVLPLNPDGWGATANFLTDGHTVIIGTSDYDLFTWDTRVEKWIERACTIAGRNLTTDEWRDAFGDRPYHETCPHSLKPRTLRPA